MYIFVLSQKAETRGLGPVRARIFNGTDPQD